MDGNDKSWATMEAYNKQDVVLLERLYDAILPWIVNHPNRALWDDSDDMVCPSCGSKHLQKRGLTYTKTQAYQRYSCSNCGAWSRQRTNNVSKEKRKAVLVGVV